MVNRKKALALLLVVVLVVSMSLAIILPNVSTSSSNNSASNSNYAGYTQIQLYNNTDYMCQVGSYSYTFIYYPLNSGSNAQGWLSASREGVAVATNFPLTTNTIQDYYQLSFAITEVQPNYLILMIKAI